MNKQQVRTWMATVVLMIVSSLMPHTVASQTVGYTYKAFADEGCNVKYSVTKQDTCYYIIVTVRSDRMKFLKEPTMMLKTFDNDVLKLKGSSLGDGSETGGVVIGNIITPITEINSTAQFQVAPEQFELIRKGISKVRLTTIPMDHERTFKSDKIGAKLYKFFLKQKEKDEDF